MQNQEKGSEATGVIALTSVFSKWYTSCIILRQEQEREPEIWKKLHVGGLQVMATNLLQKLWEWQEDRTPMLRHGSVVRPTMYLASL